MTAETATERGAEWKATACILCECNWHKSIPARLEAVHAAMEGQT